MITEPHHPVTAKEHTMATPFIHHPDTTVETGTQLSLTPQPATIFGEVVAITDTLVIIRDDHGHEHSISRNQKFDAIATPAPRAPEDKDGWLLLRDHVDTITEFSEILVEATTNKATVRELGSTEILHRLSGALGYALKKNLRSPEPLSDPELHDHRFLFFYDSTLARKFTPDALCLVNYDTQVFFGEGTPARKTDREGPGTKGTRLVPGIGAPSSVTLWVR